MIESSMDGRSSIDPAIAVLRAVVDGPDDRLSEYLASHPCLGGADEACDDLARIIVGPEDARAGRVVGHDQILLDIEARRHRHDPQAAE